RERQTISALVTWRCCGVRPGDRGRLAADAPGRETKGQTVTGEEYAHDDAMAALRRFAARGSSPRPVDGSPADVRKGRGRVPRGGSGRFGAPDRQGPVRGPGD